MYARFFKRITICVVIFLGIWLGAKYLLPVALPFLLGLAVALAAEPMVIFGTKRLRLPQRVSVAIGVSITLLLLSVLLSLVISVAVKELGQLANALPDIQNTAAQGSQVLQSWLTDLADRSPKGIRPVFINGVQRLFVDSQPMATQKILQSAEKFLGKLPGGALGLGAALLSAFMISGRLPMLRDRIHTLEKTHTGKKLLPALRNGRKVVGKWLVAQLKLSGITFGIVASGLLLLRVKYAPLLALGIALVDALPILGTGIVLLPWAGVNFLQDNHLLAIGLVSIYGAALIARTALEPRFVGSQLDIDPLLTLLLLYGGFRFWGVAGLLLTPLLAAVAKCIFTELYRQNRQK